MSRVSKSAAAVTLLAIAGCSSQPKQVAITPPPAAPAPPAVVYAPPPVSPINRGLSPAATVWHVRAALNVAALACRGAQEAGIIQRYNAMLATHRSTLSAAETALSDEYKAGGGNWQDRYDDAMTRLYNFFSQAQAREAFCTASVATLAETETLAPGELNAFAAAVLPTLDAPFAQMALPRPMIALASPVAAPLAGPSVAPARAVAAAPVAAAPAAPAPHSSPAPAVATRQAAPAAAGTRPLAPIAKQAPAAAALPAMATRAPSVAPTAPGASGAQAKATPAAPLPAAGGRIPRLEVDVSALQE